MNNEVERIWKEIVIPKLRYYSEVCPERLNETTKNRIVHVRAKNRTRHFQNTSL
jgi:hypothetical protein